MLGQDIALLRSNIYLTAGAYQDSLKLDNFPDGIYMVFLSVKTETKPVAYKLVKSAIAEIPTVSALSLFNVYPNPVLDKINIDFGDTKTEQVKLQINNSLGQVVYFADGVTPEQKIDLGFLSRGIYFLKIQNNSELRNYKIVKE